MKNELRKIAKEERSKADVIRLSEKIKNNLFNMPEFAKSKNILAYYSIGSEVSTLNYFENKTKNWYLPKIDGDNLVVCPYNNNLRENKYKILEPESKQIDDLSIIDMIIVPALCADTMGYRIGYGKGFYDRFLKKISHSPYKVILTYSVLLKDDVFHSEFDERCQIIVTDNEILRIEC